MEKNAPKHQTCEATMKLLGDFWTLRIIDQLRDEPHRFCDLQRQLGGLNPATLTNRLKTLEEAKLISRAEETFDKISVAYSLTELGREALSVVAALDRFAKKSNIFADTTSL